MSIKYLLGLVLVTTCILTVSAVYEIQVGRYSTMKTLPTEAQQNIFATVTNVQFDSSITTVGEAMRHLLENQGIRLAVPRTQENQVHTLLALPLPQIHRQLGPISLRHALETLAGPVWRLVQDPIHRLVSFELCNEVVEEGTDE
ncbi:MAG: pili assembly chaperone [Gammaproteobacteria bacterium]|nr:pili assembly chaperone [Gammaproteobacteria bacterium]MYF03279.1 pili assembly chaperone [Gammaproteobacteria bacterium]MYI77473.1 pili assembly chaperone [Gammaproteobacteria bacterium]